MSDAIALLTTAAQHYEAGNLIEAESLCHQALALEPDHLDALCLLGAIRHQVHSQTGNLSHPGMAYHRWYYDSAVWNDVFWQGIRTWKSVADMWNYQEILVVLKPSLVVEFGTYCGGATLFFAMVMQEIGRPFRVFSVDINHANLADRVKTHPRIELLCQSSADPAVADRIQALRQAYPGPLFAILDSNHQKSHVLAELHLLHPLLQPGDYLVVEDSNINGHPVLPGWGEGPYEAIQEFLAQHPADYEADRGREEKFGFTFAPAGFLIRK